MEDTGDFNLGNALGGSFSALLGTATQFGQGAIASAISGNPLYSNDPSAVGFATGGLAAGGGVGKVALAGNSNFIFLLVVGYVIFKVAGRG